MLFVFFFYANVCFHRRPTINHKVVNSLVGQPPLIRKIVKKDEMIINLKKEVTKILDMNFRAVRLYAQRFRPIHQFYTADMNFDESIIRENEKCDIFRKWCVRYRTEIEVIQGIINQQALGIFFVQLERFKKGALVAPSDKQRILEIVMPGSVFGATMFFAPRCCCCCFPLTSKFIFFCTVSEDRELPDLSRKPSRR